MTMLPDGVLFESFVVSVPMQSFKAQASILNNDKYCQEVIPFFKTRFLQVQEEYF
jgi:hypothetical protein